MIDHYEVAKRLEFLERICDHGPFKTDWPDAPRCIKCGSPADHQLEPDEIVE